MFHINRLFINQFNKAAALCNIDDSFGNFHALIIRLCQVISCTEGWELIKKLLEHEQLNRADEAHF